MPGDAAGTFASSFESFLHQTMAIPRHPSPTSASVVASSTALPSKKEKMCITAAETTNKIPATNANSSNLAPWWRRGGMKVANDTGMGITVLLTPFCLYKLASNAPQIQTAFLIFLIGGILSAVTIHGMRGTFCVVAVPVYMASLVFCLNTSNPTLVLLAALMLAILKVGICMSVCLHRYAAHAAFKCSETTRFFIMLLGCSANQGGPIWWASQHRCHHKYCDVERDPHSQQVSGVERAFSFFQIHNEVNEEFAPKHCDTPLLRTMDTWSFAVLWMELLLAFYFGGTTGLFIQYTGSWLCQTMTLWFNLANHPLVENVNHEVSKTTNCTAQDDKGPLMVYYPAFVLLNTLYPVFGLFVAERNHKHHHEHSNLAKRSNVDGAYYTFVLPLEKSGVIWDVKVGKTE